MFFLLICSLLTEDLLSESITSNVINHLNHAYKYMQIYLELASNSQFPLLSSILF